MGRPGHCINPWKCVTDRAVPKGGGGGGGLFGGVGGGASPHPVHHIMQYSENSILFGIFEVVKYCADEIDLDNVIEK